MTKVYCTICSKDKRTDRGLLPAKERYISERIEEVEKRANESGLLFVILSGKYGLLRPDDKIPYYDHLLKSEEVESLSEIVKQQITDLDATEIVFYMKPKENWGPYFTVLEYATRTLGIKLSIIPIN